MIASIALDAVGAFVCFLAFANFGLIWVRKKLESRRGNGAFTVYGNSSDNTSRRQGRTTSGVGGIVAAEAGGAAALGNSNGASPVGTPGAHSDWDGWLFSHPFFRQMFSEFRHIWFPPSYEQSQMASTVPPYSQEFMTAVPVSSQERRSTRVRTASPPPTLPGGSMLSVALGDYPPPPYSKTPRRKHGVITPKRLESVTAPPAPVHSTNATSSRSDSRISEHMTAT